MSDAANATAATADIERRRLIGEAIVQGYLSMPQTDDEVDAAAAEAMIAAEPW